MVFNAVYAQSGGVTAVINASACGVIKAVRKSDQIDRLFAAEFGILGILNENLIDTSYESDADIDKLMHTPAGAFGSCRHKLKSSEELIRIIEVFKAHDIRYFFYNGGGDSQDTALKVSQISQELNYPVACIGIPKTIDNDLPFTDVSPGFSSVAKYVAIATLEAGMDVASMAHSSTKVFILEVMGRHAGWIAAASGLASSDSSKPPHIILFPEIPFEEPAFLSAVEAAVAAYGYAVVVASEGIRDPSGAFISETGLKDAFGHAQLGGVAPYLGRLIQEKLSLKNHWAVADYLQRSARHIASQVDLDHAYALGEAAVFLALSGKTGVMPYIFREQDWPYQWSIRDVSLDLVANQEKILPSEFIRDDHFGITEACRRYLKPLIQGEAYPPYQFGLPDYVRLKNKLVEKKLD